MVIVNGLKLTTNQVYRAEVRAINTGEFISDVISGEVLVNSAPPKLAGIVLTTIEELLNNLKFHILIVIHFLVYNAKIFCILNV